MPIDRSHVIVLANHKGGCGKTTSTANLGAAFHQLGKHALLIDADPQANLSEAFGLRKSTQHNELPTLKELLDDPDLAAEPHDCGPHVIPCTRALERTVSTYAHHEDFALALRDIVDVLAPHYDVVLIDTPPGLNPLSSMALLAAAWVIVPARPADFDVAGAIKIAELVGQGINPELRLLGVLVTQADRRWTITVQARAALDEDGIKRLRTEIPFAVRVGAAPREQRPTTELEPDGKVACAYRQAATDLLRVIER